MIRFVVSGMLLCLAAPATAADCPTPADMNGAGVLFSVPGGDTEIFRRLPDGLIESVLQVTGSPDVKANMVHGLYLTAIFDTLPDGAASVTRYDFPTPHSNLPEPFPMGGFKIIVEATDGTDRFSEAQTYRFGEASVITYGTCAYPMIPVQVSYNDSKDVDIYHYLPDFGLAYLAGAIDAKGAETDYSYETFEVMK